MNEFIKKECIRYCLLMKKSNNIPEAAKNIGKALYRSNGSQTSIDQAQKLLSLLNDIE